MSRTGLGCTDVIGHMNMVPKTHCESAWVRFDDLGTFGAPLLPPQPQGVYMAPKEGVGRVRFDKLGTFSATLNAKDIRPANIQVG